MKSRMNTIIGLLATLVVVASYSQPQAATGSALPIECRAIRFNVSLAEGEPAVYQVSGQLCSKPPLTGRVIHVLLSGATYGHVYWDFPLRPEQYSYVKTLTDAGYATLNLDRIGIGASDHPPADQVTVSANGFVIHQLVQALRDGRLGRFSKVILVGHSIGSGVALVEASRYMDVDGLVVTGFLHTFGPAFFAVPATFYPAQNDPRFAARNLPLGYLTTLPGTRGTLFYWGPSTEADVVALDEAMKETITIGEGSEFPGAVISRDIAQAIHVPVLSVVGQFDAIWCTPPDCPEAQLEPFYYAPQAQLEVHVLANTGHNLNLDLHAGAFFALVRDWADRHFGR